MRSVARDEVGKGAGIFNMLRFLGGTFAIAIVAAVFAGAGSYASARAFNDGFAAAIGVCAGLSLAGAVVALGLPGLRRVSQVAAPAPAH